MIEYIMNNTPGHGIIEAVSNPSIDRTVVEMIQNGRKIGVLYWTRSMRFLPGLKPHPKYFLSDELRTMEGKVTLHKTVTTGHLATSINPFHQIIFSDISDMKNLTMDEVYQRLTKDHRILPDTRTARRVTQNIMDDMYSRRNIVRYREAGEREYHFVIGKKLVSPPGGYTIVEFKNGYDPIAWQLMDIMKSYGTITRDKIIEYFVINIGWLKKTQTIDNYLSQLSDGTLWGYPVCKEKGKGNIQEVRRNHWRYEYPLEPFGQEPV